MIRKAISLLSIFFLLHAVAAIRGQGLRRRNEGTGTLDSLPEYSHRRNAKNSAPVNSGVDLEMDDVQPTLSPTGAAGNRNEVVLVTDSAASVDDSTDDSGKRKGVAAASSEEASSEDKMGGNGKTKGESKPPKSSKPARGSSKTRGEPVFEETQTSISLPESSTGESDKLPLSK
jgi:hypothetical protein